MNWSFDGLPEARVHSLLAPVHFSELASRLAAEAKIVRFDKRKGSVEAKGAWRPEALVEISPEAFDLFFNSPFGYRGRYLLGTAEGNQANALITRVFAHTVSQQLPSIDRQTFDALSSEHAKVWIGRAPARAS